MYPNVASITKEHPYETLPFGVGDVVRLKGTTIQSMISCVYRTGAETRVKAQWADSIGDGFLDVSAKMLESILVPNKVTTIYFKCLCEKQDPSTMVFDGIIGKCSVCGYAETLQSAIVESLRPDIKEYMDEKRKKLREEGESKCQ